MADFTYGGGAEAGDSGPDLKRIVNLAGAALSAVIVAGLVWWAWTLMMRDVHGVPVVRALEGTMREAPALPGGSEASHQGLAVARIQAEGSAAPPPPAIVLAPQPPDLAPEDLPQQTLMEAAATADAAAVAAQDAEPEAVPPGVETAALVAPIAPAPVSVPETSIAPTAIEAALAEALGLAPEAAPQDSEAAPRAGVIPASVPGVARSPRPAPRPEGDGIETAPVVLAAAPAAAPAATDGQPWLSQPAPGVPSLADAQIAVAHGGGARVVQLGAFDTTAQAELEWQRLTAAHADLLSGRSRTVEQAVTNGRTFYRLRAGGFADLADARRFCVALVTNGAACIPVPQ
jgi:hypothetical protein